MPSLSSTRSAQNPAWKILAEFSLPNQSGSDRLAGAQVAVALKALSLAAAATERLKNIVAEATLKAVESGSYPQPGQPVRIRVLILEQTAPGRGWGFFLIHKMAAQGQSHPEERHYLIELFLYREDDLSGHSPTSGGVP
jgi:hypothetical protein